jgi:cytochrome P450
MEGLTIILCVTVSLLPLIFMLSRLAGKKGALPPGPPALLFVAKFMALGRSIFHIGPILRRMHAHHGPIISIWLIRTFVFVADRRLAHSMLVKGRGNFDDRMPPTEVMRLFFPRTISTSPYGAHWRLLRRNLHAQALHPNRVRLFAPARQRVCDALVGSLRGAASGVGVTVRPLLGSCFFELLVCMVLGVRLDQKALDEMEEIHRQVFTAMTAFPVFSIFPALTKKLIRKQWAGYVALRARQKEVLLPLLRLRAARGAGDPPCYVDSLAELRVAEEGGRGLTDDEMVTLCSEFLTAAMDTTTSLIEWIMAELVNHPKVQEKVYEEVNGKPDLSEADLRGMAYLKAVVLEGLRLHPGGHLLMPHRVQRDAEIDGYMVPKGAEVNFLVADFGIDETVWTAPQEFRPERFLDGDDLDITGSREIKMAPFGAGRRMCPGYILAMLHADYFVGSLVREFQWLPPAQGQGTVDMTEELASVIAMKHPLCARIIPRT